jgi:hypothetical protein
MWWRRTSLLGICFGASDLLGQAPQDGQAPGINQLIERALEQNREILASRQRVEEAKGLLLQAGVRTRRVVRTWPGCYPADWMDRLASGWPAVDPEPPRPENGLWLGIGQSLFLTCSPLR